MVTIYTTDSCPWCVKTKEYLKSKNITYQEFNVAEDMEAREAMVSKSKQMGVPVLDINDTIIIGFDREAIDKALEEKN
ncbi:glutaredoxin family protein [Clostridium sp. MSJ-8]|uniref:glutaredoxin family protein n=1 Tax=Clostridium sp. MSJ-8 TaxID=2841510 RepID=UPI001C0F1A34|nr:glutaredoxin family protein [Clostridium sp. MSJ-8]MBU5487215.1 glutaredoxin family protein [Clostridium sp. MSJ-8]